MADPVHKVTYDYARPVVTGSLVMSCEHKGDLYVAVCERPGAPMTTAGTTMRLDYPDGTPNPAGAADANVFAAALRSTKELFGLDTSQFPELSSGALRLTPERSIGPNQNTQDASQPQRGFGNDQEIHQIGVDYCTHLGTLEKLPDLHGKDPKTGADTKPTWLNLKHVEKIIGEQGKAHYEYCADDNPLIPRGTIVLPIGGMHVVEPLAQHVRDIPFKERGYNGVEGFIRQKNGARLTAKLDGLKHAGVLDGSYKPITQMGQQAYDFYADLSRSLEKSARTVG